VINTGVKKNTFCRRRLAGVDVSANTDITVALNGSFTGHDEYL